MELLRLQDRGVAGVWAVKQSEYEVAWTERQRELSVARESGHACEVRELKLNAQPLWQRLTGLQRENEMRLRPFERRSALMRLARHVERMVRAEWKRALDPNVSEPDPFADDENEKKATACRYAVRTAQWNPVAEICFYLEIAQTKLSDLMRQATGLRVQELSDCVRAEGLRKKLKERMRTAGRAWLKNEFMTADYRKLARMPFADGAAAVLKAYRSGDEFLDRSKLAKEAGLESRGRLYRAVRICERMELDELERVVALEVFLEMLPDVWAGCELTAEEIKPLAEAVGKEAVGLTMYD